MTDMFDSFAKEVGLSVVARAVDKHGSWEWAGVRSDQLERFAALDLIYEPTAEGVHLYSGEVWFGAESGRRFVRRLSSSFRISARSLDRSVARTETQPDLLTRLKQAWEAAQALSADDLLESRVG